MAKPHRKIDITQIKHKKKKRKNNPPIGLVSQKTEPLKEPQKKTYQFDRHLVDCHSDPELQFDSTRAEIEKIIDQGLSGSQGEAKVALEKLKKMQEPYLNWTGKAERTSFEVPTVGLHTHEKIDPRAIIEQVRKTNSVNYEQSSLFKKEQDIPQEQAIDFYQHDKGWSNRLIAGDSLLVMNSLLEKEGMGGKVQCIYIDPPYGIKYGSNFQPFTNKKDVKNGKDLTAEPEMIKAFRDTWNLGIHSYLSYLRDRLLLAKELLTESGSCFVQISDKNVHLVRNLMDEIFDRDNFINLITFRKTTGFKSNVMASVSDYLIWYAKDKKLLKFRHLYKSKTIDKNYRYLLLPNGEKRNLLKEEFEGRREIPHGAKIFRYDNLLSPGSSGKNQDFIFNNKVFKPPQSNSWKTSVKGLDILSKNNRIEARGNTINYLRFLSDFPAFPYTNFWDDTTVGGDSEKIYVVQTTFKVIQRCMLMTTDPGDLVLDPTCGSGTTAYVAEKYGRRWITCDTSRVAIALAKQRLMTSPFEYYKLKNPDEGIASGFEYKTVPHVTLKSVANNEPTQEEVLYDQPLRDNKKARVTGPFTVEAVPSQTVQSLGTEQNISFKYEWLEQVKRSGIRGKNGLTADMQFVRLEKLPAFRYLHAEGTTSNPRSVVISFGPEHAPLDKRHVELALEEIQSKTEKPDILAFVAFHFDPEASKLIHNQNLKTTKTIAVQMNMDLQTSDLKKKDKANESFWLIGSPDVQVNEEADKYTVEVLGWDYYNPFSGDITSGGKNQIAMWALDTDYDGRAVFPRQVFFPMAGPKDGWSKLAKSLKTEIDKELIEKYKGTKSLPFKQGRHSKIAVKIIDNRGIESFKVLDLRKVRHLKKVA